jgi:hypothetical protein
LNSNSLEVEVLRTYKLTAIMFAWMLRQSVAAADTENVPETSMFSFGAFGTLGEVHSSEDRADFTSNVFAHDGAGYTRRWSGEVDSRIAGQITANFTPRLSAVVQVIVEQGSGNNYTPDLEWANLKYRFTPDFSVRVGRILLSTFLLSDSRNVGYANPWVRPPVETYSLVSITDSDGADVSYRMHIGNFLNNVSGTYGEAEPGLPTGGTATVRHLWLMSDTVEYGQATVHIAYQYSRLTVDHLDTLFVAFRQFGPQGIALADKYDLSDKPVRFFGFGATYDPGKWFLMGEWGTTDFHSVLGESTGWYASGGYRLAKFTPYLTYAALKADSETSDPGLTVSALPPSLVGPAIGLNAGLNAALGSIAVQRTLSMGTRWDFMKNLDLKVQYDYSRLGAGSPGLLTNLQPGFRPGGSVTLISVTLDFVL